jgi:hypothetical protein
MRMVRGGGGGESGGVGDDLVDGVGCHLRCIEDDVAHECAVEEGFDAEVLVAMPVLAITDRVSNVAKKREY